MKPATLKRSDFEIFSVEGFAPRMEALKTTLRPRLTEIAERLRPRVSALAGREMHVHVAKHARRTVNPPPETWAAFSHEARGYKKTPHFALAVSRHGVHARLVLKDEALGPRDRLATALPRKAKALSAQLSTAGARDYAGWGCADVPAVLGADGAALREVARHAALKTGVVDVGMFLGAWPGDDALIDAWTALVPLYSLAMTKR